MTRHSHAWQRHGTENPARVVPQLEDAALVQSKGAQVETAWPERERIRVVTYVRK
jgi:hypothetical protein